MKKKKLYIFTIIVIVILFLVFNYEKGLEVGTWGMNRKIDWGWNFEF